MQPDPKSRSELILYQTEDGRTRLEVRLQEETVWLTQGQMAELFPKAGWSYIFCLPTRPISIPTSLSGAT